MKKIIIGVIIFVLLGALGWGIWYWYQGQTKPDGTNVINDQLNGAKVMVDRDFLENFRDGQIDDFWLFDNGGLVENKYDIDYVREELSLMAAGKTSQWSNDDSAPMIYFNTDKNFSLVVEMNFDPRADFEHAGIGVRNPDSGDWVRLSRAFDTHALESEFDIANSVYVMEKKDGEVLKYGHANFVDTKSFLRIDRAGDEFTCFYSHNGNDWEQLDQRVRTDFGQEVEVYLFVYSTNPNPIKAVFRQISFQVK